MYVVSLSRLSACYLVVFIEIILSFLSQSSTSPAPLQNVFLSTYTYLYMYMYRDKVHLHGGLSFYRSFCVFSFSFFSDLSTAVIEQLAKWMIDQKAFLFLLAVPTITSPPWATAALHQTSHSLCLNKKEGRARSNEHWRWKCLGIDKSAPVSFVKANRWWNFTRRRNSLTTKIRDREKEKKRERMLRVWNKHKTLITHAWRIMARIYRYVYIYIYIVCKLVRTCFCKPWHSFSSNDRRCFFSSWVDIYI